VDIMPQFFLNKRLIVLLVSIVILVALVGFSIRDRSHLTQPEQFLNDVVGLGESVISRPASGVAHFFGNISDIKNTYNENQKLKSRLDELTALQAQVHDLQTENSSLKDIVNNKASLSKYSSIQAIVIARNPDHWYENIVIDKGSVNGIQKDMAVITSRGLIGKIKSVDKFYSTVQLLSAADPENRVSAVVQAGKSNVYGLIQGYDQTKKMLQLQELDNNSTVKQGELVTTSGLGGIFPSGLVIGKVDKVVPDENGLTQTAYVTPAANFYETDYVMVVDRNAAKVNGGG
jgi:rod shape-determining protein MreC